MASLFSILRNLIIQFNYASFKNIKFPRGNYQTDSLET